MREADYRFIRLMQIMGSREDDYRFMQIIDAVASINQRVNLIGVVIETSLPKQSKGTDCFVSVKIVDESRPSPALSVNIFGETMDKLPHVGSAGDIIQLSHVVMKTHASDVYALFNKKFSSFALFDRACSAGFVPYQASSKFHARELDKKFITSLREWSADHHVGTGSEELLYLKEIREGEHFNLICKILHVCEIRRNDWMLFIWDGTDTPSLPIMAKLEDEMENPLALKLEPFPLPRDILCAFPYVGTVLRVTVDQGNEKLGINFLKPGRWVKLLNLKCEIHDGLWSAVLMPFTKLCYLPDDDDLVLQRQRFYGERIYSKWGWMPSTCFPWPSDLTETDFPDVPFVTLMHVLTYPEVTAKFRCVVRVVAALPWRVEDFCSSEGTYRIRLTLEDPTGRIHAFLYGEDGVKFFGGRHSAEAMTRKRNLLLGISEDDNRVAGTDASRNPPWLQCCLKSYYIDKSDAWGSRNFRIFGTGFVG